MVQISNEKFKEMADRINEQRKRIIERDERIEELEAANLFLCDQINDYNKKFAKMIDGEDNKFTEVKVWI